MNICVTVISRGCTKTRWFIVSEHVAQLLGYLRSSRMEHGLLINLGARIFQIRKLILRNSD